MSVYKTMLDRIGISKGGDGPAGGVSQAPQRVVRLDADHGIGDETDYQANYFKALFAIRIDGYAPMAAARQYRGVGSG